MRFYLRIFSYGRAYWKYVPLAAVFLLLYNLFGAVSLTLVAPFLEILFADLTGTSAPTPPTISPAEAFSQVDFGALKQHFYAWLHAQMQVYGKADILLYFCAFLAVAIVLKNVFRYASLYVIAPLEYNSLRNLRNTLFDKLTNLPLSFYTRKRRGHLNNLVTTDLAYVQEALIGTVNVVLSDPVNVAILLGAMLLISWKLTLFTLAVLPLTGFFIARIATALKRKTHKAQSFLDGLLGVVDEFVGGVRVVKAFSAEDYIRRKHADLNAEYTRTIIHMRRLNDLASPITEVLGFSVGIGIILYGGNLILSQTDPLKPSEFITFMILFSQFLAPIRTFSQAINRITRARASYERIELLLNEPVLATEASGGRTVPAIQQALEIEHLHFRYNPPPDREILSDVSLTVRKGETLALVGPSGSGKTTLVDLLCRFYDPASGSIKLDGVPLTELDGRDLRRQMGIVTQEGILFNDTVAGNIAYGEARFSQAEIEAAARTANAHEFIAQLPQGYQTLIGERGLALSGGQRQRIAIARAVLRNPPILILDEATSALDTESERLVQQALERLMEGRTVIVIAHRLSTVQTAHRIVVMQEGRVVEQGAHADLLARGGLYTKLYNLQFVETAATN